MSNLDNIIIETVIAFVKHNGINECNRKLLQKPRHTIKDRNF